MTTENQHLMRCQVCGKPFDMRDLDMVLFHETHHQRPDLQYSGSTEVQEPQS